MFQNKRNIVDTIKDSPQCQNKYFYSDIQEYHLYNEESMQEFLKIIQQICSSSVLKM